MSNQDWGAEMGRFAPDRVSGWMDTIQELTLWMGLCFEDAFSVSDPLTVEISSMGYQREPSAWVRTAGNVLTLDSDVTIHGLAPGDVVASVVGFDSQFNGLMVFGDLLLPPLTYDSGGTYVLPGGEYVVGIDIAGS